MMMNRAFARFGLGLVATLGAVLSPAFASFHLMAVQEVFPGTLDAPQAQYVVLRMTSSGQGIVNGTFIDVQDAAGNVLGRFGTFDHNVGNGGGLGCTYPNCPAILIGTSAAQTLLGFAFDQIVDGQAGRVALPRSGGRICFRSSAGSAVDCVAWGSYSAPNTVPAPTINGCDADFGAPAPALSPDRALTRVAFSCGIKTNVSDFALLFPHPVANNGANANTDADADGLIAPLDCNDDDGTALFFPREVMNVTVSGGAPTVLSWDSEAARAGAGVTYDVVGGLATDLASAGGYAAATCVAGGVSGAGLDDPQPDPAVGGILYYLVRAASSCGAGTFGDSGLAVDPRDGLDAASPCF